MLRGLCWEPVGVLQNLNALPSAHHFFLIMILTFGLFDRRRSCVMEISVDISPARPFLLATHSYAHIVLASCTLNSVNIMHSFAGASVAAPWLGATMAPQFIFTTIKRHRKLHVL